MGGYRRKGRKYSIEEVLSKRNFDKRGWDSKRMFDGDRINVNSLRLHTFAEKGIVCAGCGIEGKYFVKETTSKEEIYHFNLYAVNSEGKEVLMTKDHIKPKSLGGADHIDNMQTMCTHCNGAKGSTYEEK